MLKQLILLIFVFFNTNINSQHQNSKVDSSFSKNKLPLSLSFECTNLYFAKNFNPPFPIIIINNIEDEFAIFDNDYSYHDKNFEIGLWKSLNRYLWAGIDYSNSVYKLFLINSRKDYYDQDNYITYNYRIIDANSINSVSAKLGFGYSIKSNDFTSKNPKFIFSLLGFVGIKSNIISSKIDDNSSLITGKNSGLSFYQYYPVKSNTYYSQYNNLTYGFIMQFSLSNLSVIGGIEMDKTLLPSIPEVYIDKIEMKNILIKMGVGFTL